MDSRTSDKTTNYKYSGRDRLVEVTEDVLGAVTTLGQFDYNHEGNRIRHRYSDRGNVDYFYDDGSVLVERNADDNTLLAHYQYADRLIALAQPLGKQYYHHDALGSTIGLTDAAGADKKSYRLDPWGNIRAQSGTSDNRHIFTGQEHDPNTGLVYFGARYYDPEVGRFLTQDTYLGEANRPPSLHRYLYARSNPCRFIDPDGHKDKEALEKGIRSFNWVLRSFDSWLDNQVVTAPFAYNISGTALMPTVSRVQTGDFFGNVLANTAAGIYNLATIPANAFGEVSSLPKRALMGVGMDEIDADATLVSSLMLAPMGGQFKAPWMRGIKTRLKLDFTRGAKKKADVGVTVEKLRPAAGKSSQKPARPSPSSVLRGIADRMNPANYRPDLAGLNMGVRLKYVGPKMKSLKPKKNYAKPELKSSREPIKDVLVPNEKFPESAGHMRDAQKAGHPDVVTIDRPGAPVNRGKSLKGHAKVPGKQLDEYPPAMFKEGGEGASVRAISPADNMGAGACLGNQCRNLPDGTRVRIVVK